MGEHLQFLHPGADGGEHGRLLYFSEDQGGFTTVDENTSFYLDEDGSVVVVFPKYSIAPGAYGEQTFRIDA